MEEKTNKEEIKNDNILAKTKKEIEKIISSMIDDEIKPDNIDNFSKLIDMHKDIANEEYWKVKEEYYMYRGYDENGYSGEYGARRRDSRGRYMEGNYSEGNYGRRGVPGTGRGRYRGKEIMDEMMYHYGNYSDGMESYGADQETMKSFKYMLKAFKDYYKHLKQEASSQEEVKMLEDVAREISEM